MTRSTAIALRAGLLLVSVLLFVVIGEVALRVVYRDAGTRTLGGPGGKPFDHLTIDADGTLRGRRDLDVKQPGIPRILIIGDSITYGLGVRDWRETWPEVLARELERQNRRHELVVFGIPGNDIPQHLEIIQRWGTRAEADVLIYQWYVNDIEAIHGRPDGTRAWQRWPWHSALRASSYLYFVVDRRLSEWLPSRRRTYVDYIRSDFAPGTAAWAEFERQFHSFAILARRAAPRRILLLYPQVPFRDEYPLQSLHDRMRVLAGPHAVSIPPASWIRSAGGLTFNAAARWKQVLRVPAGYTGEVITTAEYLMEPGDTVLSVQMERQPDAADKDLGTLEIVDPGSGDSIATAPVRAADSAEMQDVAVTLHIPGDTVRKVTIRVRSHGKVAWTLADVNVSVNYGFEVLDLTQRLNTFNTHASAFDAHPNAAAHRVIAEQIFQTLIAAPPR